MVTLPTYTLWSLPQYEIVICGARPISAGGADVWEGLTPREPTDWLRPPDLRGLSLKLVRQALSLYNLGTSLSLKPAKFSHGSPLHHSWIFYKTLFTALRSSSSLSFFSFFPEFQTNSEPTRNHLQQPKQPRARRKIQHHVLWVLYPILGLQLSTQP